MGFVSCGITNRFHRKYGEDVPLGRGCHGLAPVAGSWKEVRHLTNGREHNNNNNNNNKVNHVHLPEWGVYGVYMVCMVAVFVSGSYTDVSCELSPPHVPSRPYGEEGDERGGERHVLHHCTGLGMGDAHVFFLFFWFVWPIPFSLLLRASSSSGPSRSPMVKG